MYTTHTHTHILKKGGKEPGVEEVDAISDGISHQWYISRAEQPFQIPETKVKLHVPIKIEKYKNWIKNIGRIIFDFNEPSELT